MDGAGGLEGTVAIITGGSRGLGRAMALALLGAGASISVMAREQSRLDQFRAETGGAAVTVAGDVGVEADLDNFVKRTLDEFGRIDVVISNAAVSTGMVRKDWATDPLMFWDFDPQLYLRSFMVNSMAPFLLARATLPAMMERGWGRLIFISTSLGTMLRRGQTLYGPAKAASEGLTAIMAQDLEGTGVTANVLCPGGAADTDAIPTGLRTMGATLIRPEAMGPPAVWLASHASDGVTGQRYIAKLWDPALPPEQASEIAGGPAAWGGYLSERDRPNAAAETTAKGAAGKS